VPEGERLRLFDTVGRFFAAATSEQPLMIALDDVHPGAATRECDRSAGRMLVS
jgi:hypothetical protein